MSLRSKYNLRSPGVKRLMREACELAEPTEEYHASPLEDNLFEWHFTVRGPPSSEFDGGYYHGRILLPSQYPMQPPNIILMTPNGRFEVNTKICLSISGHHPESWQPSWSIRTALLALIAFMPISSSGTIGSLDYTPEERQVLAKKSLNWECPLCGRIVEKLSTAAKPELIREVDNVKKEIGLKNANEIEKKDEESFVESDNLLLRRMSNNLESTTEIIPLITNPKHNMKNENGIWNAVMGLLISVMVILILRRILFL